MEQGPFPELHQHRPQTAPIHASKKVMCNLKFTDHFNCYLPSFIAHFEIHWSEMKSKKEHKKPEEKRNHAIVAEHNRFPEKMKRREKKGHKHRKPSRNEEKPGN